MALRAIITAADHETLGDTIQAEYVKQTDGNFLLDVTATNGFSLENVTGLKDALGSERGLLRTANASLKLFEGLDATAARAAIVKVGEMKDWDPEKEVAEKIQVREDQLKALHTTELETANNRAKGFFNQMKQDKVTAAATTAITEAKGSVALLLPIVERSINMREAGDGTLVVEVVDAAGQPRVGDGAGNPMSIPQLVEELRGTADLARAFDGTGASGSGADGGSGGGGGPVNNGNTKTVTNKEIGANLEDVASGKVTVEG